MLLSSEAVDSARAAGIVPESFYRPAHGLVFDAITHVAQAGARACPVTVSAELRSAGLLDQVGGSRALATLQAGTPVIGNAGRYAAIVGDHARARRLIEAAQALELAAWSGDAGSIESAVGFVDAARAPRGRGAGGTGATITGAAFVLDEPPGVPVVWGAHDEVLWSQGEPLVLCGPAGVGKTTLAGQLVLARMGLREHLLGLPVAHDERPVLYLAGDRPPQVARSFRRMLTEDDREVLDRRLLVWRGPLPADLGRRPEVLAEVAGELGVGTVVLDSLKDYGARLSEDEAGQGVNAALQAACRAGIEVLALHHQRKAQQGAGPPRRLADVYGSTWLTAGAGSVLGLWGEAGDAIVEMTHLKSPAETVGPWRLLHDHQAGATEVVDAVDLLDVVRVSNGITATGAAGALFGADPTDNQVEKARRRLAKLVAAGLAHKVVTGSGPTATARFYPVVAEPAR